MDNGRIGAALNIALKRIAEDLDDRPGDNRERKVTLEITAKPECAPDGLIEGAKVQVQVKDAIPTRKSRVYDVGVRKGGMMVYQEMSPDNHLQSPLPFDADDE